MEDEDLFVLHGQYYGSLWFVLSGHQLKSCWLYEIDQALIQYKYVILPV